MALEYRPIERRTFKQDGVHAICSPYGQLGLLWAVLKRLNIYDRLPRYLERCRRDGKGICLNRSPKILRVHIAAEHDLLVLQNIYSAGSLSRISAKWIDRYL